jgi:DNA-binding NarL/FixJ family response regulator
MSSTDAPHGLRVLLVDDDADHRLIVGRLLRRRGIDEILEAADAEQALRITHEQDVDLVVLDIAMPGRSGLDVLPELGEAAGDVPVVVLSNFDRSAMGDLALERGAVGYVEKRVGPDRLVEEIFLVAALTDRTSELMSAQFPSDTSAPSDARRFVRGLLGTASTALVGVVELLVSELVTNAVVHASSAPRVDVQITARTARVEVFDENPTLPEPRVPQTTQPGGRGLHLVNELASRWGAEPRGTGKVVWFEVDRSAPRG